MFDVLNSETNLIYVGFSTDLYQRVWIVLRQDCGFSSYCRESYFLQEVNIERIS